MSGDPKQSSYRYRQRVKGSQKPDQKPNKKHKNKATKGRPVATGCIQ